ncbi:MOX11-like protein, partial [Mya arenaria]
GPHPCGGIDNRCRSWLVKWDMGMVGDIEMPSNAGVRIGKGAFKYILLQIHWNNPDKRADLTDQSGMRLHVTSSLRPYDIGNVQIGQNEIHIPGLRQSNPVSGGCSGRCTGLMLPRPIHLTDIYLHMHSLGYRAALDIQREREVWERVALEDNYDYRRPMWHHLNDTAIVNPGDSVRLTCWYNSVDGNRERANMTTFGQGSTMTSHCPDYISIVQAEMCYAFVRYYPQVLGFDQCLQNGTLNIN